MRADIDALLEARSKREKDGDGRTVNISYVQEKLTEWGVNNPTVENVKIHWQKHCEVVTEAVIEASQAAAAKKIEELREGGTHVDIDGNLRWMVTVGRAEMEERIAAGGSSGITPDHVLKATAELTKRQHNEAQHDLLQAIGGGIAAALEAKREPKQIEGAEVIDAVPVEIEA